MKTLMRCIVGLVAAVAVAGVPNAYSAPTGPPLGITPVHYVSPGGAHVYPFTTWENAANDIQSAVDAASAGDMVVVSDGTYNLTNQIVIDKNIIVQGINGPEVTIIDGGGVTRCMNLGASGCTVNGFTVQNGYLAPPVPYTPPTPILRQGGGLYCADTNSVITDCVIRFNTTAFYGRGGGISGGTLYDCVVTSNTATHGQGGGGGLFMSTAINCFVANNTASGADGFGGGMYGGSAVGCLIAHNSSTDPGGGLAVVDARNCTIVDNIAAWGGGIIFSTLNNCIATRNAGSNISNALGDSYPTLATNTCSPDLVYGIDGNITNNPLFLDPDNGDYRLLATSPCVDAGDNVYVATTNDLDGNTRIIDGDMDGTAIVDMGAYEFNVQELQVGIMVSTINLNSKGRTPVAVLSTEDFDATSIEPPSVRFAGAAPIHYTREDTDADGDVDLKLHFMTADLEIDPAATEATLIGQTYDGLLVVGVDTVKVVPKEVVNSKDTMKIVSLSPSNPATLNLNERIWVQVKYRVDSAEWARIFVRPYTDGNRTPGYRAHPSPQYEQGKGEMEGWFFFSDDAVVDEIRVQMVSPENEILAETIMPVNLVWAGE